MPTWTRRGAMVMSSNCVDCARPLDPGLDVEADVHHVTILDDVVATLEPQLALLTHRRVRAGGDQRLGINDLRPDEAPGEVGMDGRRRVERGLAGAQRPGAHLLLARG